MKTQPKSINAMGSAITVLTFQCLLSSSFNIQFDHDLFDDFICCSTVILKNALMLKVALKIVTLIFFYCFHLDFKDHVSRRKYYAARNLSCDKCVIQLSQTVTFLTITLIILELRGSRGSKYDGSSPCKSFLLSVVLRL